MSGIIQTFFSSLVSTVSEATDSLFRYVSLLLSGNSPGGTVDAYNADASVNKFNLIPVGDVRNATFTPFNAGYYSVAFDGAGDYLTVANNTALDVGASDFTIECWFYPTAIPVGNVALYAKRSSGLVYDGTAIYFNGNLTPAVVATVNGTTWGVNGSSSIACTLNAWNHLAFVRNGNIWTLYVNGNSGFSTTLSGTVPNNASAFSVGAGDAAGGQIIIASYISNFRLVKGTAVYTSNFTPSTTPLTAITNTQLLLCQSNRFIDNSTNNFVITRNGDVAIASAQPFTLPTVNTTYGSGYFDGSGDYLDIVSTATLTPAGDFTIEFWAYPTSFTGNIGNAIEWYSKGAGIQIYTSSGSWGVAFSSNNSGTYYLNGSFGVGTLNAWQHVAVYRSGNNYYCALNGAVTFIGASSSSPNTGSDSLRIGDYSQVAQYPARGYISNVRYVNGTAVYGAANFTPSTVPLTAIANTQLLTLQSDFPSRNSGFIDDSINNFIITRNGNATQGTFSPFGSNWSNYFDGTGDYLTLPSGAAWTFGTGAFSVECWIYPTSASSGAAFGSAVDASATIGVTVYTSAGSIYGEIRNSSGAIFATNTTFSANTWLHVVICRDSSTNTAVFVNGTRIGSGTNTSNVATNTFIVGALYTNTALNPFLGYISNLRVVKGSSVYDPTQSTITVPTSPLTAITNTQLLTCQSNRFIDNSTNAFTITRNGDVSVQRFSPFNPSATYASADIGGSAFFDGSGDYISTFPVASLCDWFSIDYTVEYWIYPNAFASSPNGGSNVYANATPASSGENFSFGPRIGGEVVWYYYNGSVVVITGGTISARTWSHLAMSYQKSSNTIRIFINGILQNSAIVVGTPSIGTGVSTTPILIGSGANVVFNGYISNMRVVRGSALYTANFTVPTVPRTITSNTQLLLNFTNAGALDNSTMINFESIGNAQISTTQSKFGGSSMYFDGVGDYLTTPSTPNLAFGSGDFTIECWVYANSLGSYNAVFAQWPDSGGSVNNSYVLESVGSNMNFYWVSGTTLYGPAVLGTITTGTWIYYAICRRGNTLYPFKNGVLGATVAITQTLNSPLSAITIGGQVVSAGYWDGYIDDLRITKGAARYGAFTPPAELSATRNTTLLISGNSVGSAVDVYNADASVNKFNLASNGDVRNATFTPFNAGYYSVYFDGTGDYLSIADNAELEIGFSSFCIEGWIYLQSLPTSGNRFAVLGKWASAQYSYIFNVYNNLGTIQLELFYSTNGISGSSIAANASITTGVWHHIAVSRETTTCRFFLDGVQQGSNQTVSDSFYNGTAAVNIGRHGDNINYLTGYISNCRIVIGAAVYTSNFTALTSPLTAITNTRLLTCQSNRFIDNSINNLSITRNGEVAIASAQPFTLPTINATYGSGYFDGNGDYLTLSDSAALELGSSNWTIEGWFYVTSGTNSRQLFGRDNDTGADVLIRLGTAANNLEVYLSSNGTTFGIASTSAISGTTVNYNAWNHFAVTSSGGTIRKGINGVMDTIGTLASIVNSTKTWYIGARLQSGGPTVAEYFPGYISNLRVIVGTAVYAAATYTVPTAPLTAIANTQLLTLQSDFPSRNNGFIDDSINNFIISRNGNTTQGTFSPYGANWSNYFDGTGDRLSLATATAFGNSSNTVEFWFYPTDSAVTYRAIYDSRAGGATDTGYGIFQYGLTIEVYGNGLKVATAAAAFSANTWTHVALVRNSGTCQLYINGVASGASATYSSNLTSTVRVIGDSVNTAFPFVGYVSNLREVTSAVYTSNFTPPTSPLTAITNTSLLTCQSNRFIDNSTNAFTITKNGDVSVQRFSPFSPTAAYSASVIGGSGYFNGTTAFLQATAGAVPAIGAGDFQISGWWYLNQLKDYQILLDFRNGTGIENVPYIYVFATGTLDYYVNGVSRNFSAAIKAKEWTYIVVSRVGSTTKAFMNGAEVLSYTDTTTYVAGRLTLGLNNGGGPLYYYDGYIAGFRLVTGSGITSAPVPTAPPTVITGTQALLNFTNAGIIDNAMMNDMETMGNAQISTTQSKFGGSSVYFDGAGDYLVSNSGAADLYAFGSGDFTIEFWLRLDAAPASACVIYDSRPGTTQGFYPTIYHQSGQIRYFTNGSDRITGSNLAINVWYHIALARSGISTRLFVDGASVGSTYTDSNVYINGSQRPVIAASGFSLADHIQGYIDDLRVTKGEALYTANFTPPSAPFPTR